MIKVSEKKISQLRFDLVSKDWVVIAVGRAKRPEDYVKKHHNQPSAGAKDCVFCDLSGQESPTMQIKDEQGNVFVTVIPNKYPAFSPTDNLNNGYLGPYEIMDAVGFHELVVTGDHERTIAEMTNEEVKLIIDAYQSRYLSLKDKQFVNYISIFHNHGPEAGASIMHPHSQLIAIPLIDPDLRRSLEGSKKYFEDHGKCAHCTMIEWDVEDGSRVIFKNEEFVVLSPFAPRSSFEIRIYPLVHSAYFEKVDNKDKLELAGALRAAVKCVTKALNKPSYNFFFHTAPCDDQKHDHYHWHLELIPRTGLWAGFELGTGIEISTIEPERAAEFLRKNL